MTTYADVVASTLKDAAIEYIFGVPGSLSSVELIEATSKQGSRYVLCSNESSAAEPQRYANGRSAPPPTAPV